MKMTAFVVALVFAGNAFASSAGGMVGIGTAPSGAPALGSPISDWGRFNVADPPGRIFPGKYFEYKAQFYLNKKDFTEALRDFELAGYWANKRAQYNAGIMNFEGVGVPVDRPRGVAWLGIAAENHDDLSHASLQSAYASLSSEEKARAEEIFRQLDAKYGDAVAVPRALRQFNVEMRNIVGTHTGFMGLNVMVAENGTDDSRFQTLTDFERNQRDQRDALISSVTGHVTVGKVVALPVPNPN